MEPGTAPLAPRDTLRAGFGSVRMDAAVEHPVAALQAGHSAQEAALERRMLSATYGGHMALRMQMEEAILGQFGRLPSLQSSRCGLETLQGKDQTLDVADVFSNAEAPDTRKVDVHAAMERCAGAAATVIPCGDSLL